jgi:2-isopropylmalate synthase
VLVETTDRTWEWTMVGVHENVIEASRHALVDALTYGLAHAPVPLSRSWYISGTRYIVAA